MPIIENEWNSIYIGGSKGRKFEVRFCPHNVKAPWSIHSKRSNGYYFMTLRELLFFAAGRSYIEYHMVEKYQNEIADALARKWEEEDKERFT